MRRIIAILAAGLLLALVSTAISGRAEATYSEIMGCEILCDVAAAGWPAPYLVDYPGLSVSNAADLTGALVGEDKFRLLPFLATLAFWTIVAAAGSILLRRMRGGRRKR